MNDITTEQKKICVGDLFCQAGIDTKAFYEVVGITASGKTVRVKEVIKEFVSKCNE